METVRALLASLGAVGATRNAEMVLLDRKAEEAAVDAVVERLVLEPAA